MQRLDVRSLCLLVCLAAGAVQASTVREAEDLLRSGAYAEAAALARAALVEGSAPDAWVLLGEALASTGRVEEAEHAFRQAVAIHPQGALRARVALGLLRQHGADRDAALDDLQAALDESGPRSDALSSPALEALAEAARVLAVRDPSLFRDAVDYYRKAIERDADNLAARVALGDLLLEKHNNADALVTFRAALARDQAYAPALLGLARSQHFDNQPAALTTARSSLTLQPTLLDANVFIARLHLEKQNWASASEHLSAALETNPRSLPALAMQGVLYFLTGDQTRLDAQLETVRGLAPRYSAGYSLLAEMAARARRYGDAVAFALVGITLDDTNWAAMASLGINRLRLGDMRSGRRALQVAFRGDPFNVRVKNTLDLLDKLEHFATVRSARFELVAEAGRAELLAPYLMPIAEAAYDYYADRYGYQLAQPLRIELYSEHADFSVRTVGLTGLDILGASFGPVVLLDSPATGTLGAFNWASALWHEIAHSFHLAMSRHRAPRWFSEGLAVYEERLARPGWGGDVSPGFLQAYGAGKLRSASRLEEAFLAPRFATEIPFSYYLASLLIELIEREHGAEVLASLLRGFAEGDTGMDAIAERLGHTSESFDVWLDGHVRTRFGHAIEALAGSYERLLGEGKTALSADDAARAEQLLLQAQSLFPEHAGPGSSYRDLAGLYRARGDTDKAIRQLEQNIAIDADDLEAHLLLGELYLETGDHPGAERTAERALLIQPFSAPTHERLAELYERRAAFTLATRERRAVVELDPEDPAQARYQLASTLHRAGETQQAKSELLRALETAPMFDAGLELLLEIQGPRDDPSQSPSTRGQRGESDT